MAVLKLGAGARERVQSIVSAALPEKSKLKSGAVKLTSKETGVELIGQVDDGRLTFILPYAAAGTEVELQIKAAGRTPDAVTLERKSSKVDISIGGEYFSSYIFSSEVAKPCMAPVIGPYGDEVTRPLDPSITEHAHHKGIFIAHGSVNGDEIWNEPKDRHGRCVQTAIEQCESGPVFAKLVTHNMWQDRNGKDLMGETRTWRIYNTARSCRVVDVDLLFKGQPGEVVLGNTKEAGFLAVRVHPDMNADAGKGGRLESCYGGAGEPECWSYKSQWCDYSGIVSGNRVGIAAFDHPQNLRFPTRWHIRGYGLFAANPWYWDGEYKIAAGAELLFRHRVIVHAGDSTAADIPTKYLEWEQGMHAEIEG